MRFVFGMLTKWEAVKAAHASTGSARTDFSTDNCGFGYYDYLLFILWR
jgi:hypothetical protein